MRQGSRRRRRLSLVILSFLMILTCLLLAELGGRVFWSYQYGVPFLDPSRVLYTYYPQLRDIDANKPAASDGFFDVLFLGGSVLHHNWGQIEQVLLERFAFSGYRKVRIFNLAVPGHTTRDSRLKYAALSDARFDLVLIYEGINDTRANNVPPEIFREDYSHFSWYEAANILSNYHGTASFALPYMLRFLALRVRQRLTQHNYVPAGLPRKAWLQYGAEPRSPMSFERNLTAILDLAKQRGDQVLLITFAIHVPKNYSHEAFQAGQLGYGLHRSPIATWGQPEHVQATVAIHNNIIRRLATQHEGSLFVDQAKLMDGVANYFNDICHFTVDGSVRFVENVMEVLPIK